MHSCAHEWILEGLEDNIDARSYWYTFDCVANSIGDCDWRSLGQKRYAQLASHALRLTHPKFAGVGVKIPANRIYIVESIAQLLSAQSQYEAAVLVYKRALVEKNKILGLDHPSTLTTSHDLGRVYQLQGKLAKAEHILRRVIAEQEKTLGPDHRLTLQSIKNLGVLYLWRDKLDEAVQTGQRALDGLEKVLEPINSSIIDAAFYLGVSYLHQGRNGR